MGFHQSENSTQLKIVINGGLGDILLISPFVRYFYEQKKYKQILCFVPKGSEQIFDKNPFVDKVIPCRSRDLLLWAYPENSADVFAPYIDVNFKKDKSIFTDAEMVYHQGFNLKNEYMIDQMGKYYSIELEKKRPEIFYSEEDAATAEAFIQKIKTVPECRVMLVNSRSKLPEKDYPDDLLFETVKAIKVKYGDEIVILDQNNIGLIREYTAGCDKMFTVRQSAALYERIDLIVTVESFPGHLAYAAGTDAIVLFGPSNPSAYGHPDNLNFRPSDCPPCSDSARRKNCSFSKCMTDIRPSMLVDCIDKIFLKIRPKGIF